MLEYDDKVSIAKNGNSIILSNKHQTTGHLLYNLHIEAEIQSQS